MPFCAKLDEQCHNVRAGFTIEVAGRFVRQNERRIRHQRTGDGNTLTFTAGEFIRSMLRALDQANSLQCLCGMSVHIVTIGRP